MPPPRIVAAVGSASTGRTALRRAVVAAMARAVEQCQQDGITDPEVIRYRQLMARAAVLKDRGL